MSLILNVNQKQLHDYYHNTFCAQFYDGIEGYEQEIEELVRKLFADGCQKIHLAAMEQLRMRHPEKSFHYQRLY